jgi:pyruvate dehydrogenase E2 component (dihydrolipoamide acetyltransferase)
VNAEVPSPFEGVLMAILVEEGATIPNNTEIAVIRSADEPADHPGWAVAVPATSVPATPPASVAPAQAQASPSVPGDAAPPAEALSPAPTMSA